MEDKSTLKIIRWIARISGTLLAIFCFIFFIGYLIEGINKPTADAGLETYNIFVLAVWGIGLASFILAWWKEGLGGLISFISLVLLNILAATSPVEGSGYTSLLLIFLIPSILFLICWRINSKLQNKS
jgi:hypothetical protein